MKLPKNPRNEGYLFKDYDNDGVSNVDDKLPLDKRVGQRYEISLKDEIQALQQHANSFTQTTKQLVSIFKSQGHQVIWRIKNVNSIFNKFRRKHLPKIYDVGGLTIFGKTLSECWQIGDYVNNNFNVIEFTDYITNPKAGYYRALHYVVKIEDVPVEIKVMTKADKKIGDRGHKAYKENRLSDELIQVLKEELSYNK